MDILYPVFVLVALTISVVVRLGYLRYNAVRRKQVDVAYYQAYFGDEPLNLRITSRHLINLMELPVLFYLACLIAYVTGQSGSAVLALAWTYAGLRILHSMIHLGPNVVLWRFRVFVFSVLVLTALWLVLFLGLVSR